MEEKTQQEKEKEQEEEIKFTGCLSCLNDGISYPMMAVSYICCAAAIGVGCFLTFLQPLYGIGFLILTVGFSVTWTLFLHMYRDENPAIKKKTD